MGSRTKEEQHRVKTLLSDTVTLLCKNGLSFKKNLKVQGLLGITVDDDEVFIVHLNETMGDLVSASDENQPDEFHSPSKPSESGRRSPKRKRRRRSTDSNRSQSQEDTFIDLDPDIQIKTEPDMIVVDEVKFEGSPSKQSCRLADEGLNMAISSISSLDPNYSGPGTNVALSTTPNRPRTDSFSSFNQSVSDSGTTATSSNSNPYVTGFIPNVADTSNQSGSFQWDSNAAQGIPGMSNWASQLAQQTMSPSDTSQLPGPSQGYSPGQRTGTMLQKPDTSNQESFQVEPSSELQETGSGSFAAKTKEKAKWAYKQFIDWRIRRMEKHRKDDFEPLDYDIVLKKDCSLMALDANEIDIVLSNFVRQVRKQDKSRYPARSLNQIITSIQKYIEIETDKCIKLVDKKSYPKLYHSLDAEMASANQEGVGLVTKKADIISFKDENILWESGVLGENTPKSIQNAVFYLLGVNFPIGGCKEHRELLVSDFSFGTNSDGVEFMQYNQRLSKTKRGGLKHLTVSPQHSRVYANVTNPKRCLLRLFRMYVEMCPTKALEKGLYLRPLSQPTLCRNAWYAAAPLGIHTLENMVKKMACEAKLTGNYTTHSLRTTGVARMFRETANL